MRELISWEDFAQKEFADTQWLIEPYIPRNGIVFLWGETSTGKSPLGWSIARSIGTGRSFFGLPTYQGRVLYLEVDTPERLVHGRLRKAPPAQGVDFLFLPPLSVPTVSQEDQAMLDRAARKGYDLVIVNTLRKVHNLDDKEPTTPKLVYSYFQHLFPDTALMFVHHTKKTQADNPSRLKENFSGAMNWLNDAQVGLALTIYESEREDINLRLNHEKSQVSELCGPLGLWLDKRRGQAGSGWEVRCPKYEQLLLAYETLHESGLQGMELVHAIEKRVGCPQTTAWRLKNLVTEGAFPGVWMGPKDGGANAQPLGTL